ncbi:hypothetical protein ACLBWT_13355 [Paenibacillus sp. D51F]
MTIRSEGNDHHGHAWNAHFIRLHGHAVHSLLNSGSSDHSLLLELVGLHWDRLRTS